MKDWAWPIDRKSTRLNSSHLVISYAVFCLKKKRAAKVAGASALPASDTARVSRRMCVRVGAYPLCHSKISRQRRRIAVYSLPFFFFIDTAPTEISTLPLHDALPISDSLPAANAPPAETPRPSPPAPAPRTL